MTREVRALEVISLGFVGLGLALPIAYHLPPFALYRDAVSARVGDAELTEGGPTLLLCLAMTGGSIAGKWTAHFAVLRLGLRQGYRWAWRATLAGLLSWWLLDSFASLLAGAWANVVLINGVPPLLMLPLLFRIRNDLQPAAAERHRVGSGGLAARPALRIALIAVALGALTGPVIALLGDGPLFEMWRDALASAHFEGPPLREAPRTLVRFFLGPIGGSTLGHFVLVFYLVRYGQVMDRERAALAWATASVAVWFVFDTALSSISGSVFNVLLVNLPAALLTMIPLAAAWATAPARPSLR